MSTNFESYITPTFVRNLFENDIIDNKERGWAISISGKILTIGGKMFFKTRAQAVKAFYNSYSWRVRRAVYLQMNPGRTDWWRGGNHYWKSTKKVLENKYGLKFIKL